MNPTDPTAGSATGGSALPQKTGETRGGESFANWVNKRARRATRDEAARKAARKMYADENCDIEKHARVSHLHEVETGVEDWAWVQAWVLVPADAIEAEECP